MSTVPYTLTTTTILTRVPTAKLLRHVNTTKQKLLEKLGHWQRNKSNREIIRRHRHTSNLWCKDDHREPLKIENCRQPINKLKVPQILVSDWQQLPRVGYKKHIQEIC
jgi:hypothetical protein